jgi:hypothetical protein
MVLAAVILALLPSQAVTLSQECSRRFSAISRVRSWIRVEGLLHGTGQTQLAMPAHVQAAVEGQGAFDGLHDVAQGEILRRTGQAVPAARPAPARDQAAAGEHLEDLAHILLGDLDRRSDVGEQNGLLPAGARQVDQAVDGILDADGKLHALIPLVWFV